VLPTSEGRRHYLGKTFLASITKLGPVFILTENLRTEFHKLYRLARFKDKKKNDDALKRLRFGSFQTAVCKLGFGLHQGCQIFLGTTYQNGKKFSK
jgi:hypothetical protein